MIVLTAEVFFIEIFRVKILFLYARFCMRAPSLICDFIILFSFADPTIRSCALFSGSLKLRACSVAVVSMLFVVARTVRDFCGSFDVLSSNFGGTTANFPKINRFMVILRHFPFSVNLYIVICALCADVFEKISLFRAEFWSKLIEFSPIMGYFSLHKIIIFVYLVQRRLCTRLTII